jgi:Protein of unknown function (DUF1579)
MTKKSLFITTLILSLSLFALDCHAQENDHQATIAGIAKLAPLIGKWHAIARFHDNGSVHENVGTYTISYTLDNTYLRWEIELHSKDDPKRSQSFVIYTTFNPATKQYNQTYFYSNWAQRVTETGEFDDETKEYKTSALVPLEDGKHDESVRTITNLKDPDRITYVHFSRYNNENAERMNVDITLTRQR